MDHSSLTLAFRQMSASPQTNLISHSLSPSPPLTSAASKTKQRKANKKKANKHTAKGEKRDDKTTGRPTTRPRYCRIGPGNGCASPHRAAPQNWRATLRPQSSHEDCAKGQGLGTLHAAATTSKDRGSMSTRCGGGALSTTAQQGRQLYSSAQLKGLLCYECAQG